MLGSATDLTPYALDSSSFDLQALVHWLESTFTTTNPLQVATQLEMYAKILLEWNISHNLSTTRTMADMLRQIVDSILPLRVIKPFDQCLDIGSGAGLPALVLGILCQQSHFTLCEPRKKRAAFLRFVAYRLGLRNICVENARVQDLSLSQRASLITSRASLSNTEIFAITRSLIADNGAYLLYKGEQSYHIALNASDPKVTLYRYNARIYVYKEL